MPFPQKLLSLLRLCCISLSAILPGCVLPVCAPPIALAQRARAVVPDGSDHERPATIRRERRNTAQIVSSKVPGRYLVVYSDGAMPIHRGYHALLVNARVLQHLDRFGIEVVEMPGASAAQATTLLAAQPGVAAVLQDRYVQAHRLDIRPASQTTQNPPVITASPAAGVPFDSASDLYYSSPQQWAVRQAGGYGAGVSGGPATGPWNYGMGAGVRIAVLDSGVDAAHPDIAPNLALNLSEVDQAVLPSPCDDSSPQDQTGHGTWTASLAAAAIGPSTGGLIGVAPQATLLNIKVLERLPAATGANAAEQCNAGQAGGLLSWVLQGMEDAIAQHAHIISLSLGSIVDLYSGDGYGWKAAFDRATRAAAEAGVLIIASAGNDGLDLSAGRYIELPAQARSVLAVVASTNPDCAENLSAGAQCTAGQVTRPYYSNYGITHSVSAPGGSYPAADTGPTGWILGACSSGQPNTTSGLPSSQARSFGCFDRGHTAYIQAMGTSASAPLAAGAAALVRAAHPGWTPAQIIGALLTTASNSGPAGPRINTLAAVLAAP